MDQPCIHIVLTHTKYKYAENSFLPITSVFKFRQHTTYNVSLATEEDSKRIHIGPSLLNIYVLFMLQKSGICMQTMIM